ncbi:uncharacterized protein LOC120904543 [Anopheles arabiensis]|uniref:uncharacterized protein LOC120904543 n=1 Tax=Anopheles arabiensis TaxID=7173 RepID=UPI001AAD95AB|nr:uncharacterized protein LOC120904543 [Anopheles arabiensis]
MNERVGIVEWRTSAHRGTNFGRKVSAGEGRPSTGGTAHRGQSGPGFLCKQQAVVTKSPSNNGHGIARRNTTVSKNNPSGLLGLLIALVHYASPGYYATKKWALRGPILPFSFGIEGKFHIHTTSTTRFCCP